MTIQPNRQGGSPADLAAERPGALQRVGRLLLRHASLTGLVGLVVASSFMSPHFLTAENLFNVLRQWTMVGLIAVGLAYIIIGGGIDLSGGSILALAAVSGALLIPLVGVGWTIVLVLLIGLAAGYTNGAVITWLQVPPFVATLGMMTMARGLALILTEGRTVVADNLPASFTFWLGRGYLGPVPAPVVLTAGVFGIGWIVLRMTPYGRSVSLVGDNLTAAFRCGVKVERVQRSIYSLHGVLAAMAGLLFLGRLGVGEPTAGMLYELSGIAAVVIGGTPFTGGTGGVGLTVVGLLVIALTYNILNLLSVSPYAQDVARGVIIILAVAFSIRRLKAS